MLCCLLKADWLNSLHQTGCIGNFHKPTEYFVLSKRLLQVLRSPSIFRDVQQLTDTAEKKLLLFRKPLNFSTGPVESDFILDLAPWISCTRFFVFCFSAFTLSVCETFKYLWFWFSLTGLSWKDILIVRSRGTQVNPWETMTSNGSRLRDYQVCCGASTTWDLSGRKEWNSPRGNNELPSKISRKVPVKDFSPVSHRCFRILRF